MFPQSEETNIKSSDQKMEKINKEELTEESVNENICYTIDTPTPTSLCNHIWVVCSHPTIPCSIVQCDICGVEK